MAKGSGSRTSPPIYRHFLSGAPESLRLSAPAVFVLIGFGAILFSVVLASGRPLDSSQTETLRQARRMLADGDWLATHSAAVPVADVPPLACWSMALALSIFGADAQWVAWLPSALATLLTALLLAAVVAPWLGRRVGLPAGLIYLTMAGLPIQGRLPASDALLTLSVTAAIGAFALGNMATRHPVRTERWVVWGFHAAAGLSFLVAGAVGPFLILGIGGLTLYFGEDSRGIKFFANPTGLMIFAASVALWPVTVLLARPAGWDGRWDFLHGWFAGGPGETVLLSDMPGALAGATLPWTPLILLAIVVGLWRGHGADSIWRLLSVWVMVPLVLMAIGIFRGGPHLGLILPPLAVMAAAGLVECWVWSRRHRTIGAGFFFRRLNRL